jgi:hypothetical protein
MEQHDRQSHSENRSKINELFEGFPPFDDEEAETNHIDTNVNFLEAPSLAHKARSTWNNAFLKPGNFFTITLDSGPIHKRNAWSHSITKHINRAMKGSLPYIETIRATGAQVILHGIGPKIWEEAKRWRPTEIGIEDLLFPSNTWVNLRNLSHFALFRRFTAEELFTMTHGKHVDPGWQMPVVEKILARLAAEPMGKQASFRDTMNPEKIVNFYKANSGFLDSDCVPPVNVWHFYHKDEWEGKICWFKKTIVDDTEFDASEFLYNPERPYAGDLSQLLHLQFGDGANVAPFFYHTVRSLGYLLFAVCHLQNRLRCSFMDAIMRATHEYFRIHGGDDRARMQKAELVNLGLVPEGLEFVPRDQRWQVDEALVVAGLSQNRQLMSENASAFVQDVDSGSGKELTATEVMARLNNANALVSSLLSMAYTYAEFEYREIARRFTIENSGDKEIEKARLAMLKDHVPAQYLNVERWQIQTERVMGGGNKTLELTQAKAMMEVKSQFDTDAQREILRDYTLAVTDDPDKADRWIPDDEKPISASEHDAQLAVGALMNLAPVGVVQGIDHIGYVETMLLSMKSIMDDIKAIGQPTPQQVVGLMACFGHVSGHIQIIAQDEENVQRVKRYGDFLKPIMNQVKAWSQQLGEAARANAQQNGEQAQMAAELMKAQSKIKIAEVSAAKKEQRKDIQFVKEQKRKDAQTMVEAQRQQTLTGAQVASMDAKTAADLRKKRVTTFSETDES